MTTSFFGFLFWIVAAMYYLPEQIGLATGIICAVTLLVNISKLGIDQSLIRYFPDWNKEKAFFTSAIVTSINVLLLGSIFLLGLDLWAPELANINDIKYIFLLILLINSLTTIMGTVFIADRSPRLFWIQSLIISLRVFFLIPLIPLGTIGIFGSFGVPFLIALIFSALCLKKMGIQKISLDFNILRHSIKFSIITYISSILLTSPSQIIPMMVLSILGPIEAAQYYITYSIASVLFMIPLATSTSLFVEGSHGESLKQSTIKTLIITFILLICGLIFIFLFGHHLLGLIGSDYQQGYDLLILFAFSSLFSAVFQIFISIKKVQKDIRSLVPLNLAIFTIIILSSYMLLISHGIIGVGYAWILSYIIICSIILFLMRKEIKSSIRRFRKTIV